MIKHNLPMSEYQREPGVSVSRLKMMQRSPAYAKLAPSKPTPAKDFGTAVHCAVLEPEMLSKRYGIDPESPESGYPAGWRNRKDYKMLRAYEMEQGYDGLLTRREMSNLDWIVRNVERHEIGKQLHALPGHREVSVFAEDQTHVGLVRKCRPDWWIPSARTIVDVKTAVDHRAGPFSRACKTYGYHMGAAYYLDTASEELGVENYVFLVVNAEEPFEVSAYTLDSDSIEQGRREYQFELDRFARCVKADHWPDGSGQIEEIRLPEYAINYHNDGDADLWQ